MSISRILTIALTLGLGGMTALLAQITTSAPPTTTREASFPPVGVAQSESMQINVSNEGAAPSTGTASPCTGTVSFLDATGKAIAGTGGPFSVTPGQTQSIMLGGSKANTSTLVGARAEIRAVVALTVAKGVSCSLVDSLETFDSSSGVTHVYLVGSVLNEIPFPLGVLSGN